MTASARPVDETVHPSNMRLLIVSQGPPGGTSARLFDDLAVFLRTRHDCERLCVQLKSRTVPRQIVEMAALTMRSVETIARSTHVFFHVSIAPVMPLLLIARLLGKRTVTFVWDVYPISIDGRLYNRNPLRLLLARVEQWFIGRSRRVIVPSDDFVAFVRHPRREARFLWPHARDPHGTVAPHSPGEPLRIAFVGQINETRGLDQWLEELGARQVRDVELHVFSSNAFARPETAAHIVHRGHVSGEALSSALSTMHYGLVSLHPQLDQPGFPSKTFEYVSAGLPILYYGRPLDAYTTLLTGAGVGVCLPAHGEWPDLAAAQSEIVTDYEPRRQAFLAATRLNWSTFDPVR